MRIVCIGGGPAGLYFSVLAKLSDPTHEVTVLERNPAGVTYGWGVVFWDDLLDDLFRCDPVSARMIWDAACRWDDYEVRVPGKPVTYLGGYGFSLGRHRLLDILARRAVGLGVDIRYTDEVDELGGYRDADLVVVCDGAGSRIREQHAAQLGPHVEVGANKYIWLGTPHAFDTFTFAFERTAAGWIWFHAYPFAANTSTCIVECAPQTWAALGLDRLGPDESTALLQQIFARHLNGEPLVNQRAGTGGTGWLSFRRVTNERWHCGNLVLMGDAAHTTHFAIGSGTKLAMQDAIALAHGLAAGGSLPAVLDAYEQGRRTALEPLQRAARASSEWFENLPDPGAQGATEFAYSLSDRRGEYPMWRYLLHVATQRAVLRSLLRRLLGVRRWSRGRRRLLSTRSRPPSAGRRSVAQPPRTAVREVRPTGRE